MGWKEDSWWLHDLNVCPVCGKKFAAAVEHVYKIGTGHDKELVCSYTCMRNWQKEQESKKTQRPKKIDSYEY